MGKGYALSSRGRKLQRSQPANRLGRNNQQFAPAACMAQRKLPGNRKTAGQPKNKRVCFSVCPAVFRCALAHSRASFAGLPGSGEQHFCFSLILLLSRRQAQPFSVPFRADEKERSRSFSFRISRMLNPASPGAAQKTRRAPSIRQSYSYAGNVT